LGLKGEKTFDGEGTGSLGPVKAEEKTGQKILRRMGSFGFGRGGVEVVDAVSSSFLPPFASHFSPASVRRNHASEASTDTPQSLCPHLEQISSLGKPSGSPTPPAPRIQPATPFFQSSDTTESSKVRRFLSLSKLPNESFD